MRILADECIAPAIVASLRGTGHDVLFALEAFPSASDSFILSVAERERRVLLTEDNDYGELVFHRSAKAGAGIVLIRMPKARRDERWSRLRAVLDDLGDRILGKYVIIGSDRVRMTQLPPR
ncbi:MAG TPA: DUF5615 family PIN-like protein [Rhizomicrobium sp.]|jgi:predicted nuclease of predicted toxin-antitoxin system|nr:DUF5615 family PIN-like protein [Rhizomicrobium sp.]